jgi:hypothetical protein
MILGKQGRNFIPLGRELKQFKKIIFRIVAPAPSAWLISFM